MSDKTYILIHNVTVNGNPYMPFGENFEEIVAIDGKNPTINEIEHRIDRYLMDVVDVEEHDIKIDYSWKNAFIQTI